MLAVPYSNDDFLPVHMYDWLNDFVCCASELEYFYGFRRYRNFKLLLKLYVTTVVLT